MAHTGGRVEPVRSHGGLQWEAIDLQIRIMVADLFCLRWVSYFKVSLQAPGPSLDS